MSIPAWKQAIFERRKKQEDEQKKKQAEEEAYLATLPPWKRALFQKREKERQQQLQQQEKASCERSNSFLQRQQQLAQERESQQRRTTSPCGWSREVTPPSVASEEAYRPISPTSPPHGHSHQFVLTTSSTQPTYQRPTTRRTSVTTLPGVDEVKAPIAEKVANAPIPHPTWESRPRSSSTSAPEKKVVSSVKKFNELKTQSNEIPAWKKALLQRRKEKEMKAGGGQRKANSPEPPVPTSSLPVDRKESPPEVFEETDFGISFKNDQNDRHVDPEPVSLLAVKRKPSPEEAITIAKEPSIQLQRRPSPIEPCVPEESNRSPTPEVVSESTQSARTHCSTHEGAPNVAQPKKAEPKPLAFGRKPSPIESTAAVSSNTEKSNSLTGTRNRVSSITSTWKSHENNTAVSNKVKKERGSAAGSDNRRSTPKRSAPAPPPISNTHPQTALPKQQNRVPSSRPPAQQKPVPEVVNRTMSEPLHQSQVMQTEGVTHRAPVYKEVGEWANVSEDDPKFRSLPTWKQALIKRRRADIAKRTTSVDDVPLSNGPVPNNEQGTVWNPQSAPSEDCTTNIPPWKKQMMQRKIEEPPTNSSSNVRALTDKFNDRSTPSPPSPTSTTPVVTIRSPSPSSGDTQAKTPATSSRPDYSSSGVPQTSSTHSRKSFTWTPGEDTMPGDALSDDSSDEEGEDTVTNIDDTSSEEEEDSDSEKGDSARGVVLLQPLQAIVSRNTNQLTKRSILVDSSCPKKRPLRRVAFSDSELAVEHYYPKYDYSDYEDIQEDEVSTSSSFSFWKSKEVVEAASDDEQSGLSQRLHPSLRSPEPDPDNYRYSPSRDSTSQVSGSSPPTLQNYKPSILSSYGDTLHQSYSRAMENGTAEEEKECDEVDSGHLMPAEGPALNFYASLSSDTAAMLW